MEGLTTSLQQPTASHEVQALPLRHTSCSQLLPWKDALSEVHHRQPAERCRGFSQHCVRLTAAQVGWLGVGAACKACH